MRQNSSSPDLLKIELIDWLSNLNDLETINDLMKIKNSKSDKKDWWEDLSLAQKKGIENGLNDVVSGNYISHEEVKKKYGL